MAEVARELRFADGTAAPQEPGDHAGGLHDPEAAALARESGCGGDEPSLSGASDGRPLSDATRKVLISVPMITRVIIALVKLCAFRQAQACMRCPFAQAHGDGAHLLHPDTQTAPMQRAVGAPGGSGGCMKQTHAPHSSMD